MSRSLGSHSSGILIEYSGACSGLALPRTMLHIESFMKVPRECWASIEVLQWVYISVCRSLSHRHVHREHIYTSKTFPEHQAESSQQFSKIRQVHPSPCCRCLLRKTLTRLFNHYLNMYLTGSEPLEDTAARMCILYQHVVDITQCPGVHVFNGIICDNADFERHKRLENISQPEDHNRPSAAKGTPGVKICPWCRDTAADLAQFDPASVSSPTSEQANFGWQLSPPSFTVPERVRPHQMPVAYPSPYNNFAGGAGGPAPGMDNIDYGRFLDSETNTWVPAGPVPNFPRAAQAPVGSAQFSSNPQTAVQGQVTPGAQSWTTHSGSTARGNMGRGNRGRGPTERGNTGRGNTGRGSTGRGNTGRGGSTGRGSTGRGTGPQGRG